MNTEQIERICDEYLGEKPQQLNHMTFGHSNLVYEIKTARKEFILRANADAGALQGMVSNLNVLSELSLPVPKVDFLDLSKREYPFAWMLLTKIPGRDLKFELPLMTKKQMTALANQIVSIQRKVGELPLGSGYGWVAIGEQGTYRSWADAMTSKLENNIKRVRHELTGIERGAIKEKLAHHYAYCTHVQPRCFLDDITIKNVIMCQGELQGIIDFDWVCYGDPLYMIALTEIAIVSDIHTKEALFYIEELCRLSEVDERKRAVIDLYSLIHALEFLAFHRKNNDDQAYERVRTSLNRWI